MVEQFSIQAFIFILILIIYILAAHFIEVQKVPYLHQSGIAIFMGFLTAVFVKYGMDGNIVFDNQIFFAIILPPIIFSAGYSLRKSLFFQNFGMISFLGVIGTVMGFILLSSFCYLINWMIGANLNLQQIMMLSSVLCATDTVAAMSLIKPQKFPVLNAVLFGQGIINDAVAIVLFRTVQQLKLQNGQGITQILWMIIDFLVLTFFSLIIGAIFGFSISYLFKINPSFNRYPIKQTSMILLTGYVTYLVGQLLGYSGIITLFTCAIIMGHYAFMNISDQSQRGTGLAFQTVSYIAEAFVYAYLGASVLSISSQWGAVGFASLVLVFLPFVRAAMVYILPAIYNCTNKTFPLNSKQLKVCWYSGLVRGVIAFALVLQIQSQNRNYLVTIVLFTVLITTLIGASLLKPFCQLIGLKNQAQLYSSHPQSLAISKSLIQQSDYNPPDFLSQKDIRSNLQNNSRSFRQKITDFQNTHVRPIFKKTISQQFNYDIEITSIKKQNDKQI